MIEMKENAVFRDGERIGTVEGESLIVPEKLHHNVLKKLERETGLTVVIRSPDGCPENQEVTPDKGNAVTTPKEAEEPAPPVDHRGDKTPTFIEWMFRNRPEEAATRYANRIFSRQ